MAEEQWIIPGPAAKPVVRVECVASFIGRYRFARCIEGAAIYEDAESVQTPAQDQVQRERRCTYGAEHQGIEEVEGNVRRRCQAQVQQHAGTAKGQSLELQQLGRGSVTLRGDEDR
jgi:hypothetical protein